MQDEGTKTAARRLVSEALFMDQCRAWSLAVGGWSVRAAALRAEREQLDRDMADMTAKTTMLLMQTGMPLRDAEAHVETLIEKAFSR